MKIRGFIRFLAIPFCIILMVQFANHSNSQSIAEINNVAISRDGSSMIITYDIVKADTNETFNIEVIIISESGIRIIPSSIHGDINEVPGGINKKIIWEIEKDSIRKNEKFSIDVVIKDAKHRTYESPPDTIVKAMEFHRNVDIGFGLGLDYGGAFGIKIEYIPLSHLGIFASGGVQFSGFGWQVGAIGYFIKKTNTRGFRLFGKFMYGTNASIYVQGMEELNNIYTGPTIGIGMEIRFGKQKSNGLNIDLNVPFRSQEYQDDWDEIKNNPAIEVLSEPLPITISIGYHFEF